MISGLVLINERGDIIISRLYRDDVSRKCAEAFREEVVVKKDNFMPVRMIDGTSFLCVRKNGLYFTAMTKSNVNPSLVFEFLYQLDKILQSYLGEEFTEKHIRDNFTLVYELLDEVMDFGYPQTCSTELLQMYINLGKIQKKKKTEPSKLTAQLTGAIDWRRENIHHKQNEIFIDVAEQVGVLISTDGTVLSSEVLGVVKIKAYLSGMPECKFGLNDKLLLDKEGSYAFDGKTPIGRKMVRGVDIADCTFHRCVRLGRFDVDRSITFIPPDGEFELMRYRIAKNVHLPFQILPVVEEIGKTQVQYNIRLISLTEKESTKNLVIKIPCPTNTAKTKPHVTKGRAKYDPVQQAIIWRIKQFRGGSEASFFCPVDLVPNTKMKKWSRPPIQVDFSISMFTASGLEVRYIYIIGTSYETDRWVKYSTKAQPDNYQIRI